MFRTIKAIFFCLLSTALSLFCILGLVVVQEFSNIQFDLTNIPLFDNFLGRVLAFNILMPTRYIILIGSVALIFEMLFSKSMNDFFYDLPLGGFDDFEDAYGEGLRGIITHIAVALSPAFISGVYVIFYMLFHEIFPSPKIESSGSKWLLPITLILVCIAAVALIYSSIRYGGLWGLLVRLPLLFSVNLCFCLIGGIIIFYTSSIILAAGIAVAVFIGIVIMGILSIPITIFALRGHTSR